MRTPQQLITEDATNALVGFINRDGPGFARTLASDSETATLTVTLTVGQGPDVATRTATFTGELDRGGQWR